MNSNQLTLNKTNLLNAFIAILRSHLKDENIKYPLLFSFSQKLSAPKISKMPFNSILLACWFENNLGKEEIFFKSDVHNSAKFPIRELPFDRCVQIELHEDYLEEMPYSDSFEDFEDFALVLSQKLKKEKSKIELVFSSPVYIHEFSLIPKTKFIIYARMNPLSSTNGNTWNNKICLFADSKTNFFYQADIVPFQYCLNIRVLEK